MADLFSGLDMFGLDNLGGKSLFNNETVQEDEAAETSASEGTDEKDFLYDKNYTCKACGAAFKNKTIRIKRVRIVDLDMDLRPRYDYVDPIKYDVVMCPECGYTALERFFDYLTPGQTKMIRSEISSHFLANIEEKETYTFEDALTRYKLALANAVVKHAKASEKAYICLKIGWVLRSMGETLDEEDIRYNFRLAEITDQENEYLKNALEGFLSAVSTESFPICGMDTMTMDYLIAVLAFRFNRYDVTAKRLKNVIDKPKMTNPQIHEKAKELLEIFKKKVQG